MRPGPNRRGEEWAIEQERLQVAQYGFDPDKVVHWQSKIKEDSNYDIRSVDADGHPIYIEVKATDGGDLHLPLEITNAELQLAVRQRDRYLIYRVLNTNTATPRLVRYRDPVGRILTGQGAVKVTGAKLYLAPKAGD